MANTHLIIGANTELGLAYCRELASSKLGARFVLVGDNAKQLRGVANDLRARNMRSVTTLLVDYSDPDLSAKLAQNEHAREATNVLLNMPSAQFSGGRGDKGYMKQQLQQNAVQPISVMQRLLSSCPRIKGLVVAMQPMASDSIDNNVQITSRSMISAFLASHRGAYRRKGVNLVDIDWRLARHVSVNDIKQFDQEWLTAPWVAKRITKAANKRSHQYAIPSAGEFRRAHSVTLVKMARVRINTWGQQLGANIKRLVTARPTNEAREAS